MDKSITLLQNYNELLIVCTTYYDVGYIYNNVLPSTYHRLYHLFPSAPHFIDKLKDVEVISLLQSLHHCIKSDESASATHTSTGGGDEHTDTHTEQTIMHIQYLSSTGGGDE